MLKDSATPLFPDPRPSANSQYGKTVGGITVAELLLDYLKLEGVNKLFGIPGGALIHVIEQLRHRTDEFDFVICRHETGAAYIAHGYALVSGELGVVLTTAGPAATNALTGTMNAQASNSSVLTITGEVPQNYFGQGYLQEGVDAGLDVQTVYRNAVEFSTMIPTAACAPTLFQQALRDARSQPNRAAHISLPNDVAGSCATSSDKKPTFFFPNSPDRYRATPSGTDTTKTAETLAELVGAKKPLLFLGNGTREALRCPDRMKRFCKLVEDFALPVMTTPDAKGIFPETHELSLRNYGMTACSWPTLYMGKPGDAEHFDALVVLGSSLGELATSVIATDHYSKNLIPNGPFTQIDLDQSVIGRDFPITRGIVGDTGATIDAMCAAAANHKPDPTAISKRLSAIQGIKESNSPFFNDDWRNSTAAPCNPAALVRVMNEEMSSGHIFIDAGNCVGWSLNNLVVDPPLRFHSALDMGPMGFGVGAVIGGKIAKPDDVCVALVGDGAFMMHGMEVSTAAQNQVGAIWIVLNDNDLSMVSQGMAVLYPPASEWNGYYKLGSPDLAKVAVGLGADAYTITREQGPEDFAAALKKAITAARTSKKPQVIDVHIDVTPAPNYGWPKMPPANCPTS